MWIMPQHASDIEQFKLTLEMFRDLTGIKKNDDVEQDLLLEMENRGIYNPQIKKNGKYDKSTANHKIDEVRFYGGIYSTPNNKIHITPYGELLLKHWDDKISRAKIFSAMLFNIQYPNPFKSIVGESFNIYPMRLIFKLLLDKRLDFRLSNLEVCHILYSVDEISSKVEYNKLVDKVVRFRKLKKTDKENTLKTNSGQFIINYVNFNYCINILTSFGVLKLYKDDTGYLKLKSPKRKKETSIRFREIGISSNIIEFIDLYESEYSVFNEPIGPSKLKSEWIREIYNFVGEKLLYEIDEKDNKFSQYLQIPNKLIETSINGETWYEFEEYITNAFMLFDDIRAEKIGGPGEPDALCHLKSKNINFVADGKATGTKLIQINDGRLKQHRKKYNAEFTIVITPDYRPSAVKDILNTHTCVITSYCFSDLISRYVFKRYKHNLECRFENIYNLIWRNLGKDISEEVYKFIDVHTGVNNI